ncbi:MAG: heavy-metal-associated domain-containing protein [Lentisphaerales bacterium]|nr:heavy-metal-associated domain-containing protein [Lentisphaerales bacterium]
MIRLLLLLVLSYMFVSCHKGQVVTPVRSNQEGNFLVVKIKEMGCRSCVRRIKKHLYETEGIQAVKANIPEQTLTFKLTGESFKSRAYLKAASEKALIGKSREIKCMVCSNREKRIY